MRMISRIVALVFLILAMVSDSWVQNLRADDRPNFVLIMVDDMGFSDLGCYGGEIETPHLDNLAASGLRFKQFYNNGRCCPTRAALITGIHPHQAGIGHMTETPEVPSPLFDDPYQGYLNGQCTTVAEVLKSAGYSTLMTGKWHLGYHRKDTWPLQRGFEKFFGIISGASHYFRPDNLRGLTLGNEPFEAPEKFYVTDAFTDYGIDFIEESLDQDPDKPFFLYLSYNAPHWPLQAKPEDLAKYEGKYKSGWTDIAEKRMERMKAMGLVDPAWTPAPHEGPDWDSLSEEQKHILDLRMAAYAACVDSVDQNVGKLVSALKKMGQYENTVILFLDDNGACAEGGILGSGNEESVRDPLKSIGTAGPRCGRAWANVSSTPFRLYKHYVHEGGMATPLIVHWPAGVPGKSHGRWIENFGYLPDIMATFLELAQTEYPTHRNGQSIHPAAGKSLLPLFQGWDKPIHTEPVFWEHEGNRAMRDGKWKLVWANDGPWELFNLDTDRTEMHDLSQKLPQRAARMQRLWEGWARRSGVQFQSSFSYYKMIGKFRRLEQPKKNNNNNNK